MTNVSSAGMADGNVGKGSTQSTRTSLDIHGSESKPETGSSKSADLRLSAVKDDGNEVSDRAPLLLDQFILPNAIILPL